MKKTIITLFALAGIAAAETLTFDVEREGDTVTFEFDEATAQEILTLTYTNWSYSGSGANNIGSWQTPSNTVYQNSFSPDAQLRSGSTDSWTMNFSVTNESDSAITLTQFTFDAYGINGGGSDKNAAISVTLTLGQVSESDALGNAGTTSTFELDLTGNNAVTIKAHETMEFALTMSNALTYNTYSGITAGSVTYALVPEPTTATLSLLAMAGLAARRRRK